MITRLSLIHAMSPLHAGTGQAVGTIDLPIARERPTGIPLLPGSSIKGALRARGNGQPPAIDVFGPETTNASDHSGAVQFSDAHVVLFPVRSVAGTFAWVTSPYLLQRFARTAREARLPLPAPPAPLPEGTCRVAGDALVVGAGARRKVVFEDLDFTAEVEPEAEPAAGPVAGKGAPPEARTGTLRAWAHLCGEILFPQGSTDCEPWRATLLSRLCLIGDDPMSFLLDHATEVAARVRLNEATKTVARGALWYQESLPAETVLAGLVVASDVKGNGRTERKAAELLAYVETLTSNSLVQLGGKASVGHGSCVVRFAGGAA